MNTEQELRPCPHCGMPVTLQTSKTLGDRLFVIACPNTSPCANSGLGTYVIAGKRDEAITAWNRRSSDEQAEVVEVPDIKFVIADYLELRDEALGFVSTDDERSKSAIELHDAIQTIHAKLSPPAVAAGGVTEEMVDRAIDAVFPLQGYPRTRVHDYINADPKAVMRAALSAALAVRDEGMREEWQPIETLPELSDMQSVMIAIPRKDNGGWIVGEATWRIEDDSGALWWAGTGPGDYYASPISEINDPPTHWQPLPAPPILKGEGE